MLNRNKLKMKKKSLLLSLLVTFGFATSNLAQTFGNGVTDIDGNSYPTVIIGTQEWMASNLKTTHYSNGDPIDFISDPGTWANCVNTQIGAWCHVNNNSTNDSNLGLFYNWYAALTQEMFAQLVGIFQRNLIGIN